MADSSLSARSNCSRFLLFIIIAEVLKSEFSELNNDLSGLGRDWSKRVILDRKRDLITVTSCMVLICRVITQFHKFFNIADLFVNI